MIRTFRDKRTEHVFKGRGVRQFQPFIRQAEKRLAILNAATSLGDLAGLSGNRLETLKGSRKGQHSIRINDQWRLCFQWLDGDAFDVEIVDYH